MTNQPAYCSLCKEPVLNALCRCPPPRGTGRPKVLWHIEHSDGSTGITLEALESIGSDLTKVQLRGATRCLRAFRWKVRNALEVVLPPDWIVHTLEVIEDQPNPIINVGMGVMLIQLQGNRVDQSSGPSFESISQALHRAVSEFY